MHTTGQKHIKDAQARLEKISESFVPNGATSAAAHKPGKSSLERASSVLNIESKHDSIRTE